MAPLSCLICTLSDASAAVSGVTLEPQSQCVLPVEQDTQNDYEPVDALALALLISTGTTKVSQYPAFKKSMIPHFTSNGTYRMTVF